MVDETGDIPDRSDVAPDVLPLISDIIDSGEIEVTLVSGETYELHGHDTYIFETSRPTVYTKDADDDVWFYADQVTSVRRHY